jgi:lipopolysaccharide/colanic/teichoic acid biosynthesis glycosyltransferase
VILIISIAIKVSDKGKIIYSQNRLTRGNREFKLYKFRTMIENAEDKTGPVLAKADDLRITKPGKFLRASRLDEIPQLFNVLKGEMSIIGPRPERPSLMEETVKTIPEFSYRTLVKAGVTGLAQTLGRYNTEFKDKVRFDLYYVNNYSLLLDLKILFYTFHTLFTPSVAGGIKENMDDEAILKAVKEKGVSIV